MLFRSDAIRFGALTIGQTTSIDTQNGALQLGAVTGGGFALTLRSGTGAITGTSVADVTGLTILDASALAFSGPVTSNTFIDLNGTQNGLYAFGGLITAQDLTTNVANNGQNLFSVALNGGAAINNGATVVAFDNTGDVFIGDGLADNALFSGGVTTTAIGGTTNVAGTVRTGLAAGQLIAFNDTMLIDNAILEAGAGTITLASVDDNGAGRDLRVQSAGGAATGAVSIGGFTLGSLTTRAGAYTVSLLDSGTVTGDTNFNNTVSVTLGDDGAGTDTLNFLGGLDTRAATTTFLGASVLTSDTNLDLGATTLLATDTTTALSSGTNAISIASVAGAGQTLTLQGGGDTGNVAIAGTSTIGSLGTGGGAFALFLNNSTGAASSTTLGSSTTFNNTGIVSFGNESTDSVIVGGDVDTLAASSTRLGGTLTTQAADGAITLGATTLNAASTLSSGAGAIVVASASGAAFDLALQDDTVASTGTVTLTGNATLGSLTTFGQAYDVSLLGGGTITGDTNFLNTGSLVLNDGTGDQLTFTGGLATTGNGTNPSALSLAGTIATGTTRMDLGAATLTTDTTLNSAGAVLNAGAISSGGNALTLNGGAAGAVTVTSLAGTGNLAIVDSASTTFTGTVDAATIAITDTTGTVAFQGNTSAATGFTTQSNPYSLSFTGATNTIAGTTTFNNGAALTLGDGGDAFTFDAGVIALVPTTINLNGTVSVNSGVITLGDGDTPLNVQTSTVLGGAATSINLGQAVLSDDVSLQIGDGAAATVTLAGAIGTNDGGATTERVEIETTGVATITGAIGGTASNALDELQITQSGGTSFQSTVNAQQVTLTDTTGAIAFLGNTTIGSALTVAAGAYDVALTGSSNTIAGATRFDNTGTVTIGDAAGDQTTFVGGLDTTAPSATFLAGGVLATNSAIDLGVTELTAATRIVSGSGATTIASVLNSANQALTLQDAASTGAVSVTGGFALASLTSGAGAFDLTLASGGTVSGATTLANTGVTTLGDGAGDTFNLNGGLTSAASTTNLFGAFASTTSSAAFSLGDAAFLGTTSIATQDGDLTLGATTGNGSDVTIDIGNGTFSLASLTGGGAIAIDEAESTSVAGNLQAASLSLGGGSEFTVGGNLAVTGAFVNTDIDLLTVNGTTSAGSLRSDARDGELTFVGNTVVTTGGLALNDGVSTLFQGALDVQGGTFTTGASAMSLALNGATTVAGATSLQNTGAVVLGDDGDTLVFSGGLNATAAPISLFGSVRTAGTALTLGTVTLAGDSALSAGAGGTTTVASITGSSDISFNRAAATIVSGALTADTAIVGATDSFTVGGALALTSLDTSGAGGARVTLTGGGTVASDTTFGNSGGLLLGDGDGDRFEFTGGFDSRATATTLNAVVATDSAAMDFAALTIAGDSRVDSTNDGLPDGSGAAVSFGGAIAGAGGSEQLEVLAGVGNVDASAGIANLGSFFVRSGGTLTLGEVSLSGNTLRAVVGSDVALNGNITDTGGDITVISKAGTLVQADNTQIISTNGSVHLIAGDFMRIYEVQAPNGDILLSLLGDGATQDSGVPTIVRGRPFGEFDTDLIAGGVVAVATSSPSRFGSVDNGFRISAAGEFVNVGEGGQRFVENSNASALQQLGGTQRQAFGEVVNQTAADRLVTELKFESAQLVAAISGNSTNRSQTNSIQAQFQATANQASEEEALANLSEDVFIDITLVNAEQQPVCLPASLQGFDAAGCAGADEKVASWMSELRNDLVAAARTGQPLAAAAPRQAGQGAMAGGAGGGGG
ncbi:MAG TPA: hypothetical protein VLA56_09900 [Pseudomonadales bacterium]|nr:hypothetical protein [Pseudomonadales bacterium]